MFCPCFLTPLMGTGTRQEGQSSLHTLTYPSPEGEVPSRAVGDSPCSCQIAPTCTVDNPASLSLIAHRYVAPHTSKTCTLWYHGLFFKKHDVLDIQLTVVHPSGPREEESYPPEPSPWSLTTCFLLVGNTNSSHCHSRSRACPRKSEEYPSH